MTKQRKRRSLFTAALVCFGLVAFACGGGYAYLRVTGNFHAVEQGVVYRSGQLSAAQLDRVVKTYGIQSVLNLRGKSTGSEWYDDELAECDARHVVHSDYGLSAERFVTPLQSNEILQMIATAPKPILIHCKAGSDRAGLVSALYRYAHGVSAAEAKRELSFRFGHFPYLLSGTIAMDKSFDAYVKNSPKILKE